MNAPYCKGRNTTDLHPCLHRTANANGYCYQHQAQAPLNEKTSMNAQTVGDHDPMVFKGGGQANLGVWVECECGWISRSWYSDSNALTEHGRHVAKVGGPA